MFSQPIRASIVNIFTCLQICEAFAIAFSRGPAQYQAAAPWGLQRLSHKSWEYSFDGNTHYTDPNNGYFYHQTPYQVNIYMLDSGVDTSHPELDGRASWGHNFLTSANTDDNGHGTHLSGIAIGKSKGVARNAKLIAVKILDSKLEGTVEHFSQAVDWVINDLKTRGGRGVINYSAVGEISDVRAAAIGRATKAGIFVVNAAGNAATNACNYGPANMGPNYTGFATVAALNYTSSPAGFSNVGSCIDLWAPGVDIESSLPGGIYGYMDGTSNAAAFVSGLVAYYWGQNPALTLEQIMFLLRQANSNGVANNFADTTSAITYNFQ